MSEITILLLDGLDCERGEILSSLGHLVDLKFISVEDECRFLLCILLDIYGVKHLI
jgi:hypothetical protein